MKLVFEFETSNDITFWSAAEFHFVFRVEEKWRRINELSIAIDRLARRLFQPLYILKSLLSNGTIEFSSKLVPDLAK